MSYTRNSKVLGLVLLAILTLIEEGLDVETGLDIATLQVSLRFAYLVVLTSLARLNEPEAPVARAYRLDRHAHGVLAWHTVEALCAALCVMPDTARDQRTISASFWRSVASPTPRCSAVWRLSASPTRRGLVGGMSSAFSPCSTRSAVAAVCLPISS